MLGLEWILGQNSTVKSSSIFKVVVFWFYKKNAEKEEFEANGAPKKKEFLKKF